MVTTVNRWRRVGRPQAHPQEGARLERFATAIARNWHDFYRRTRTLLPRLVRHFRHVDLCSLLFELLGFLTHASFHGLGVIEALLCRVLAHVLRDLHGAEVGTAHRAE